MEKTGWIDQRNLEKTTGKGRNGNINLAGQEHSILAFIRREEGMESSIVPSKCNSRAQLGPQVILEGRSGKGSPRIKNGSHRLKLADKMERGGRVTVWLTMAQGALTDGSLGHSEPSGGSVVTNWVQLRRKNSCDYLGKSEGTEKQKIPREFRASFTTAIELCRYNLDR